MSGEPARLPSRLPACAARGAGLIFGLPPSASRGLRAACRLRRLAFEHAVDVARRRGRKHPRSKWHTRWRRRSGPFLPLALVMQVALLRGSPRLPVAAESERRHVDLGCRVERRRGEQGDRDLAFVLAVLQGVRARALTSMLIGCTTTGSVPPPPPPRSPYRRCLPSRRRRRPGGVTPRDDQRVVPDPLAGDVAAIGSAAVHLNAVRRSTPIGGESPV